MYRCDSTSGRRSPHTKDNIKKSNGNVHPGNSSNRMLVNYYNIKGFLFTLNLILCVTLGV